MQVHADNYFTERTVKVQSKNKTDGTALMANGIPVTRQNKYKKLLLIFYTLTHPV